MYERQIIPIQNIAKLINKGVISNGRLILRWNKSNQTSNLLKAVQACVNNKDNDTIREVLNSFIYGKKPLYGFPPILLNDLDSFQRISSLMKKKLEIPDEFIATFRRMINEDVSCFGIRTLEIIAKQLGISTPIDKNNVRLYIENGKVIYQINSQNTTNSNCKSLSPKLKQCYEKPDFSDEKDPVCISFEEFQVFKLAGKMKTKSKSNKNLPDDPRKYISRKQVNYSTLLSDTKSRLNELKKYLEEYLIQLKHHSDDYEKHKDEVMGEHYPNYENQTNEEKEELKNKVEIYSSDEAFAASAFFEQDVTNEKQTTLEQMAKTCMSFERIFDVHHYKYITIREDIKKTLLKILKEEIPQADRKDLLELYGNFENFENDHIPANKELKAIQMDGDLGICIRIPKSIHALGETYRVRQLSLNSIGQQIHSNVKEHLQTLLEVSQFEFSSNSAAYVPLYALGAFRYLIKRNLNSDLASIFSANEKNELDKLLMKELRKTVERIRLRDLGII